MTKKTSSTASADHEFEVQGTLRNQYHQPMPKATVKAYSKGLRGKHLLGETVTDAAGWYTISYTLKKATTNGVFVCAYENHKNAVKRK